MIQAVPRHLFKDELLRLGLFNDWPRPCPPGTSGLRTVF